MTLQTPQSTGDHVYGSDGLTQVEQYARRILEKFPDAHVQRTRDIFQIELWGEEGVVLVLTPEAIELRLPTLEWTHGTHGPVPSSRLWQRHRWGGLKGDKLWHKLALAKQKREEEFRECRYCGQRVPPEHRIGEDVCHGCASTHLGVVF